MRVRGRPKKYRIVRQDTKVSHFSPRGRPGRPDEATLTMDEYEAIRLADFLGYTQKEAAQSMHISQQTFSRILRRAHRIIAESLVYAKIIRIQGGSYVFGAGHRSLEAAPQTPSNKPQQEEAVPDINSTAYLNLA